MLSMLLGTLVEAAGVCRIGKKEYESLSDAVDMAKSGQTITMLKSCKSMTEIIVAGKKLVIDFQKKKYTYKGEEESPIFTIRSGASLTLRNMNISSAKAGIKVNGKLILESGTYKGSTIMVENAGVIKITGGTYKPIKEYSMVYLTETARGKAVITGGTFIGAMGSCLCDLTAGRLNIYGGTFKAKGSSAVSSRGNVNIYGGEFSSDKWGGNVIASWGKLTISGGKFTPKGDLSSTLFTTEESQTRILGGTFYGLGTSLSIFGRCTISKGTFLGEEISFAQGSKVKVNGGEFKGSILVSGEAEFEGGTSTRPVYAWDGGKVTIHDFNVELSPSKKEACLINSQGSFLVKGGSFTAESGYGYEGDVRFETKDVESLFHVKRLKEWDD